jgi:hypothetical protein
VTELEINGIGALRNVEIKSIVERKRKTVLGLGPGLGLVLVLVLESQGLRKPAILHPKPSTVRRIGPHRRFERPISVFLLLLSWPQGDSH